MDYNCKTRTVSSFVRDVQKGKFDTNHRLQRKEGQWGSLQRSELIDSMCRSYPIDPIRCEVIDGIGHIFDGIQRTSNIRDFVHDKYRLNKALEPVTIDGVEYEIAGKKFSKLDQAVQDKILSYELQVYLFSDCTDADIREMYRRQNNGKQLTGTQKRTAIESDDFSKVVFALAEHDVFNQMLSKSRIKADSARDYIREVYMLLEGATSFRRNDIDAFVKDYTGEKIDNTKAEKIAEALDHLIEYDIASYKLNASTIPMVIAAAVKVLEEHKDFDMFVERIERFSTTYEDNVEYKSFCGAGTGHRENVQARWDYWKNIVDGITEAE